MGEWGPQKVIVYCKLLHSEYHPKVSRHGIQSNETDTGTIVSHNQVIRMEQ